MARTPEQIADTDREAEAIGYVDPPDHLQPTGPMFDDPTWTELVDYFDGRDIPWARAIQVYVSRRWDEPIPVVYAEIDSWKKLQLDRIDKRDNPDDFVGGYN